MGFLYETKILHDKGKKGFKIKSQKMLVFTKIEHMTVGK